MGIWEEKTGFKQELFPGIPIQVLLWIKSTNFGNEVEKMGMILKNSLQNQTFPLLFPNPDFPNPNPRRLVPFPKNLAPKSPKFPNFPIPADGKAGKSILESQKRGKETPKNPNCASKLFYSPRMRGGVGGAGPGVPWLRPQENPGILLIQICGISGFFWHQRSFLCRISQAILFRK